MSAPRVHAVVVILSMIFLSVCVASAIEQTEEKHGLVRCELTISHKFTTSSIFRQTGIGLLHQHVVIYKVNSNNSHLCELPIESLHGDFDSPEAYSINIYCNNSSPWFTHKGNLQSNLLVFLGLHNCNVSLMNIGTYGKAVDLKTVSLIDATFPKDSNNETSEMLDDAERAGLMPIHGLTGLASLYLAAKETKQMTIPHLLFTNKWPELAELTLQNIIATQLQIDSLNRSMPRLQSLDLLHSARYHVPSSFPWAPMQQLLPRNLSRSAFFNEIYAGSLGLVIEPELFRRRLYLENNGLADLSQTLFKGDLDMISLASNQIYKLGEDTFSNLKGLQIMKLNNNNLIELPQGVFTKLVSLRRLDLSHNDIRSLPEGLFIGLSNLCVLKISHNFLQTFPPAIFSPLIGLILLDLSNNEIRKFGNNAFDFRRASIIREINLDYNKMEHFPKWIFTMRSLKNVKLSRNPLSFAIFARDLAHMSANSISFYNRESASSLDFPFKPIYHKTIDLSYNNFSSLNLDNIAAAQIIVFRVILNFFTLNLNGNDIKCDCHTYKMYKFLNEQRKKDVDAQYKKLRVLPFHFQSWKCSSPTAAMYIPMVDVQKRTFLCQKKDISACPKSCICLERSFDRSIMVNCSARQLSDLPKSVPKRTDTLLFSRNLLRSISDRSYFRSLNYLDVSNNKIEKLTKEAIASLDEIERVDLHDNRMQHLPLQFKFLKKVNLTLSRNIFACDCHDRWIVRWIFDYRLKIMDIDDVKCSSGYSQADIIYQADINKFICEISKKTIVAIAITGLVVMFLVILVLVLGYIFCGEIKVFLYFHFKWHPFDRTDNTDIVDKLYDAFVSYNQADVDYVLNTLKPVMESSESPYRLCIHERDFRPGRGTTENVLYSVKYSRRMIMVLTKNYLKSEWCRLEFKSAHRRVLKDRSNYLIVILFDGLNVDDLDEEMKLYLKTNTYIKHDCKWFWQRLRYALPQKPLSLLRREAFPKGGYEALFPSPSSVAIMQTVQNIHNLAMDY